MFFPMTRKSVLSRPDYTVGQWIPGHMAGGKQLKSDQFYFPFLNGEHGKLALNYDSYGFMGAARLPHLILIADAPLGKFDGQFSSMSLTILEPSPPSEPPQPGQDFAKRDASDNIQKNIDFSPSRETGEHVVRTDASVTGCPITIHTLLKPIQTGYEQKPVINSALIVQYDDAYAGFVGLQGKCLDQSRNSYEATSMIMCTWRAERDFMGAVFSGRPHQHGQEIVDEQLKHAIMTPLRTLAMQ